MMQYFKTSDPNDGHMENSPNGYTISSGKKEVEAKCVKSLKKSSRKA